jgi:biotin transport system substrate-specific component
MFSIQGVREHGYARALPLALAGSALIAVSAKLHVAFWPVPMTLQTLAIFCIAALFGWRLATLTMAAYLVEGAFGLPVFSGTPERGIGLAYMLGPTGGYLLGYVAAAALIGAAAERWRSHLLPLAAAMLLGLALVYACGVAWLAAFVPVPVAFAQGLVPFVAGDLVKIAGALTVAGAVRRFTPFAAR